MDTFMHNGELCDSSFIVFDQCYSILFYPFSAFTKLHCEEAWECMSRLAIFENFGSAGVSFDLQICACVFDEPWDQRCCRGREWAGRWVGWDSPGCTTGTGSAANEHDLFQKLEINSYGFSWVDIKSFRGIIFFNFTSFKRSNGRNCLCFRRKCSH